MIIMQNGCGLQSADWQVTETRAPQFLRIYLMDGGNVVYEDAVTQQNLRPGMLYLFPAQQPYRMMQNPSDPIRCLWMHADVLPYVVSRLIEIDPADHPDLSDALSLFRRQILCPSASATCIEAFARCCLHLLIRDGILSEKIDSSLLSPDAIHGSIGVLSRKSGYSEEHFIRSFRRTAGITPYQYILSLRMNEAISLLIQGLSMEEIASRIGYASGKSFSGAFKRRFGISPEIYRETFTQKA